MGENKRRAGLTIYCNIEDLATGQRKISDCSAKDYGCPQEDIRDMIVFLMKSAPKFREIIFNAIECYRQEQANNN